MPSPVNIFYKRSFKEEYKRLPPTIRSLFDSCCSKFEEGEGVLRQQGWLNYAVINDSYVAWGMHVKDPDGFLWMSIASSDRLPMIL